jgi:hypothetical protein
MTLEEFVGRLAGAMRAARRRRPGVVAMMTIVVDSQAPTAKARR